jgi:hypothetical protein
MGTPIQKEFGPGYDYPNRKFHLWAVILPTILVTALAVALMRHTGAPSSRVTRSPIIACPKQMCPPPGSTDSAKSTQTASTQTAKKTSAPAAGLNATETAVRDLSLPTVTSATGSASGQPSSPAPGSNLSPTKTSPSPSSSSSPSATPVLSVTRAMLSQASSAVTHAVILSSA